MIDLFPGAGTRIYDLEHAKQAIRLRARSQPACSDTLWRKRGRIARQSGVGHTSFTLAHNTICSQRRAQRVEEK